MKAILSVFVTIMVVAYPFAVYGAMQNFETSTASYALAGLIFVVGFARMLTRPNFRSAKYLLGILALGSFILFCGKMGDVRGVLITPVLINLALLGVFASSLWGSMPLVERFARMQVSDLSPAEIRYCRSVTIVWCLFFTINAFIAGGLALLNMLGWWTTYTGFLSYLLMGTLGISEYCIRKYRFGRFGQGPHDRVLKWLYRA